MRGSPTRDALALIGFVAVTLGLGSLSGLATQDAVETWYPTLTRPAFTPPAAAFPIAWTILYVLMGVAVWRVWRLERGPGRARALALFAAQFLLNLAWSPAFFGLRSTELGVIVIVPLLALLVVTTRRFWALERAAGLLLIPYVAWVAYATVLAIAIWWLNF